MESAFGRLYRTSRLASHDSSIKQVYTTFAKEAWRKEWGLKRAMPSKLTTRLATVSSLDTHEQTTGFASANQQFMLTAAWKENFTASQSPGHARRGAAAAHGGESTEPATAAAAGRGPQRNLGQMTRSEWRRFLEEARARRSEWREALEKGNYAPEETLAFMNATNAASAAAADGVHWQPTYHDAAPPSEALQVYGRVLNRMGTGYAVAVQGIIASLPLQNHALEAGFAYRDVKRFYVHSAKFDAQGRPAVVLGLGPRGARDATAGFSLNLRYPPGYAGPRAAAAAGASAAAQDRYLDSIRRSMALGDFVPKDSDSAPLADALDVVRKARR
ncbi:hypothetical protein H4R18_003739 [Coemansia javaensis]|uniref:Uncharacterized protein n=1 Tax=Coemansia javaensis TaxID=2761396 RepID=A0A9W8HB40_9FUNG|nr:hypothetical protein H4R18_003739 [Coemansia javaensis]